MATFRESVADAIGSTICAIVGVNDDAAKLFGRVVPPLSSAADYANFFAPLRAQFCNDDPADYVPPESPLDGGQCPTLYNIAVTYTFPDAGCNTLGPFTDNITGRLGPLGISYTLNGAQADAAGGLCPGYSRNTWVLEAADNNDYILNIPRGINITNVDVSRADGLPDDCGSAPIPPIEPAPVDRPINITYDTDNNTTVNIDGTIRFGPAFSTGDLNLRVPFNLDLGGLNWAGDFRLTPTVELNLSPRFTFGGGGEADPTPIPPRDPTSPPPPPLEPGEPTIIGVIVRANIIGEQRVSSIATDNIPDIWVPRLGSVSFAINAGLVSAWTPDIDVKNADCYIPCPAPQGASAVAATASPGVSLSWVPVRGRPLLDLSS